MSHIIALTNLKGGVGKTTTSINLGGVLAEMGQRVLIVDVDPQANATLGLGIDIRNLQKTIKNVLLEKVPLSEVIINARPNLDILPSHLEMAFDEDLLYTKFKREERLKIGLEEVAHNYDFILIDCQPSMSIFVKNALAAAEYLVVPMSCDYYAMLGVSLILQHLPRLKEDLNPSLKVAGILVTRYDGRTKNAEEVLNETKASLGDIYKVFDTIIRETVRLREQPIYQQTITEYAPNSNGADDYRDFAKEFLNEFK